MAWRVSNAFINLSDRNQQGIPKDTLQMDDVIDDMTSVSELSSLEHPRTGVALLLQLLSVKSRTRERTPRYFARGGKKLPAGHPALRFTSLLAQTAHLAPTS